MREQRPKDSHLARQLGPFSFSPAQATFSTFKPAASCRGKEDRKVDSFRSAVIYRRDWLVPVVVCPNSNSNGIECRMEPEQLDPKHCGDLLRYLDKQNEFLMESYRLMVHELQKLQVEEEMLMHTLYEVMPTQGITKKSKDGSNDSDNSYAERSYESH